MKLLILGIKIEEWKSFVKVVDIYLIVDSTKHSDKGLVGLSFPLYRILGN